MTISNFKRYSKKKMNNLKSTKKNTKHGGNPPRRLPNIFRIYTTGIADDGRDDIDCYRNIWNRYVREEILQYIPENFNNIQILHFDTFEGGQSNWSEERKNQLERTLRENLTNGDENDTSGRVVSSEFHRLPVDLDTRYPFLIIDFAGIIRIINSRQSELRDQYIRIQFKINGIQYNGRPFYAPFLYIGYGNRDQSYFVSAHALPIPLLRINENGYVVTYQGHYRDRGLIVESPNPLPDIIDDCKVLIKESLNFVNGIRNEPVKYNKIAQILSGTQFIHNVFVEFEEQYPIETIISFPRFIQRLCDLCVNIINENIETKDLAFFDNYRSL
jgi:hypothetical protein